MYAVVGENINNGILSNQKLPEKTSPVFYKQFVLVTVKDVALAIVAEIAARHDIINLVIVGFYLRACFVIGREPVNLFGPYL
jgi:hypothetical protein